MSKKTAKKAAKKAAPKAKKTALRGTRRGKKVVAKAAPAKKKAAPKKAAPKKAAPKKAAPKKKAAPAKPAKKAAAPPPPAPPPPVLLRKPPPAAASKPADPVKALAWKDVSVTLDGEDHDVIFFDWLTLQDAKEDPSPTARHYPSRNPLAWVEQFDEYVVGNWVDPVDEGEWQPIAVVGLGQASTAESFAEMNNRGFLAIVKKAGSFPAGTVLWLDGPRFDKDEPFVAAPHLGALAIIRD